MIHNYVETLERYKKPEFLFCLSSVSHPYAAPFSFMYSLKENVRGLPMLMTLTSFYFDKDPELYRFG